MDVPDVGAPVLWRLVPDGAASYVYADNLVACDEQVIAIFQPVGAPTMKRTGLRGGPRNSMIPGGWDGGMPRERGLARPTSGCTCAGWQWR